VQAQRFLHSWKNLVTFNYLHKQVTLQDDDRFLQQLADPGGQFLPHLTKFQHRTAVGATHWDLVVPFCTAAISSVNPFPTQRVPSWFHKAFWRLEALQGFAPKDARSLHSRFSRDVADDQPRFGAEDHPNSILEAHVQSLEDEAGHQGDEFVLQHNEYAKEDASAYATDASQGNNEDMRARRGDNLVGMGHQVVKDAQNGGRLGRKDSPSDSSDDAIKWMATSDGDVRFSEPMLPGLSSAQWRRIAFTLHRTGASPHTFPIGKPRCEWASAFIDLLIDMIEDTCES
jgi:hypothetical protein